MADHGRRVGAPWAPATRRWFLVRPASAEQLIQAAAATGSADGNKSLVLLTMRAVALALLWAFAAVIKDVGATSPRAAREEPGSGSVAPEAIMARMDALMKLAFMRKCRSEHAAHRRIWRLYGY